MTIKSTIREALTRFFPTLSRGNHRAPFVEKSAAEIFATIYRKGLWGGRLSLGFHSGSGSRDKAIVAPYISAVREFLLRVGRPSVVDLGCGDFRVGSQLVDYSGRFIGCDIVDFVIERNRGRFPSVEFQIVNAIDDELPKGDVVLIRQVLQHLSNEQVRRILPKLSQYKYAIITEHIPGLADFTPNVDKETGADHRVAYGSGIVLTEPPFNLKAKNSYILCEAGEFGGIVRTILFEEPSV
jgi:SAM-dependent methyltransferase